MCKNVVHGIRKRVGPLVPGDFHDGIIFVVDCYRVFSKVYELSVRHQVQQTGDSQERHFHGQRKLLLLDCPLALYAYVFDQGI